MSIATLHFDTESLTDAITSVDLDGQDRQTCEAFGRLFGRQARTKQGDDAFQFLAIICYWRLRPDDEQAPFDSVCEGGTLHDISDAQVETIASIVPVISNSELRARLSDLVWVRRRDHRLARTAAADYVTSAERLITRQHVVGVKERLSRAVQLAARLGRNEALFADTIQRITAIAQRSEIQHCTLANCLDVLCDSRADEVSHFYQLAVERAEAIAKDQSNLLWERRFWELASVFAGRMGDKQSARSAAINSAQTLERQAEQATLQAIAAQFWEMALHAYRGIASTAEERARVHQKLLEAQKQIPNEMIPIESGPIDLTDLVSSARDRIRGKAKTRALAELVYATRWLSKEEIRRQADDRIREFPLQHMFPSTRFGSTGKVSVTASGTLPSNEEIVEDRLLAEMCQQYKYFIGVVANGTIEPMRADLLLSHNVTIDDVAEFVNPSPFVPPGREAFFTIGIHAGIHGRFVESLHVLIPQLEHVLRYALNCQNVITSGINDKGIQREFDLNEILFMSQAEQLLGEDLCFVLRVLLIDRHGCNLRNELAHGMKSPGFFFSDMAVYAWWLVLRIVGGPFAIVIRNQDSPSGECVNDL